MSLTINHLNDMKVYELKKICRERKLKGFSKCKRKDDLSNFIYNEISSEREREILLKEIQSIKRKREEKELRDRTKRRQDLANLREREERQRREMQRREREERQRREMQRREREERQRREIEERQRTLERERRINRELEIFMGNIERFFFLDENLLHDDYDFVSVSESESESESEDEHNIHIENISREEYIEIEDEKTDDRSLQCTLCLENKKNIVPLCGHFISCNSCSKDILTKGNKKCPICRKDWKNLRIIYH